MVDTNQTDARFQLALQMFEQSLARLKEAVALEENDVVRDALIQRFEFTFEMGWKAAYRWLRARGADVPQEAFTVLPRAFANGLIRDEVTWTEMRRQRNLTSHTYNLQLAVSVAAFVRSVGVAAFDDLVAALRQPVAE